LTAERRFRRLLARRSLVSFTQAQRAERPPSPKPTIAPGFHENRQN